MMLQSNLARRAPSSSHAGRQAGCRPRSVACAVAKRSIKLHAAAHTAPVASEHHKPQGWRVLAPGAAAAEQLPRPRGRPVPDNPAGDVPEIAEKGAFLFTVDRMTEFGPLFEWSMGPMRAVDITDYDTIRTLMAQDGKVMVAENAESFAVMLGEDQQRTFENPEARMAQRKFLAPGFTERATAGYIQEVVDICREQLDAWAAAGQMDLSTQAKDLSFEFSTRLLVKFKVPADQKPRLRALFDDLFRALISPAVREPGTPFMKGLAARDQLREIIGKMVEDTPELMASVSKAKATPTGAAPKGSKAACNSVFETMLLARQEYLRTEDAQFELSVKDVAQAGIGLIIAGNDTSGLGITGLLGMLPMFPEVMQKVRQEQELVMAAHGPDMSRAALEAMPYTEAVVKEVLRLLPPARGLFRKTTVDLEINGTFIPKGTFLHLNFVVAQLLTDPGLRATALSKEQLAAVEAAGGHVTSSSLQQEFNPDRWLLESTAAGGAGTDRPKWAGIIDMNARPSGLLTFGSGPHVCLGMGLFFVEAKVLLALLARDYTLGLGGGSPAFTYSFFPELRQRTVLNIGKRAAAVV